MKQHITASLPPALSSTSAEFYKMLFARLLRRRETKCAEFAVCHFMSDLMSSEVTWTQKRNYLRLFYSLFFFSFLLLLLFFFLLSSSFPSRSLPPFLFFSTRTCSPHLLWGKKKKNACLIIIFWCAKPYFCSEIKDSWAEQRMLCFS